MALSTSKCNHLTPPPFKGLGAFCCAQLTQFFLTGPINGHINTQNWSTFVEVISVPASGTQRTFTVAMQLSRVLNCTRVVHGSKTTNTSAANQQIFTSSKIHRHGGTTTYCCRQWNTLAAIDTPHQLFRAATETLLITTVLAACNQI